MLLLRGRVRADSLTTFAWELGESGAGRRTAGVENREQRNAALVAATILRYDCGRGDWREKDEDRGNDQPLQRYPAERHKRGKNDQGDANNRDRPACSWHCTFIVDPAWLLIPCPVAALLRR